MAVKTLICGLSGTGKSRSMKSFAENNVPVAVVNPVNKPLPFRNNFKMLDGETDSAKICAFMMEAINEGIKTIVVDDFQYLLAVPYMRRVKEGGWDKYNDFAANYFTVISVCDQLPPDVTVYFMTHTETLEDGQETVKLIGKMLREKICIEGLFTIVLKTLVSDGKYYFTTQNNGKDNVKSPEDMFPSYAIDNDLKYVDDKIRNYYHVGQFLTDEEIEEIDKEAENVDITKEEAGGKKKRSRRRSSDNDSTTTSTEGGSVSESGSTAAGTTRRRRSTVSEDMSAEREEVEKQNEEAVVNAGMEEAGDKEEVAYEDVKDPEMQPTPRRQRKPRGEANTEDSATSEPETEKEPATHTRRRRR